MTLDELRKIAERFPHEKLGVLASKIDEEWNQYCLINAETKEIIGEFEGDYSEKGVMTYYFASLGRQTVLLMLDVIEASPNYCTCGIAIGDPRISSHATDCQKLMDAHKALTKHLEGI